MAKDATTGTIEIEEDLDFQRTSWRVQRAGWVVMLALIVGALAGVCGGGPVASAEVGDRDAGMLISYERFTRLHGKESLELEVSPAAVRPDSMIRVWLDRAWIESADVESVTPQPESTELGTARILYVFRTSAADAPLRIRFDLKKREMGSVRGRGGIDGGPTYSFTQFTYP